MPVVALKSTIVTAADAAPVTRLNSHILNGMPIIQMSFVPVAAGDDDGSTFRMHRVPSHAQIISLHKFNTALTSGTAFEFGVYQTAANGGAVVDADAFGSAVSLATADTAGTNILFENTSANPLTNINKRLWEMLGLSADPRRDYDLVITATTIGTADGTIATRLMYTF